MADWERDEGGYVRLARLLYEAGALKRVPRAGWGAAGVDNPESVAEHSFRTAVIAFFLARMEGADPFRAAVLALFHDLPEARTLDLHKVAQRYFDTKAAEQKAGADQAESLPPELARLLSGVFEEAFAEKSPEARVAKDADHLECLLSAAEYRQTGHPVSDWISNNENGLSTESARKTAAAALSQEPFSWWKGLKKE
ncbi:MAG: HD domain-containing protein [Thermodesulfobacteriota bacterium]